METALFLIATVRGIFHGVQTWLQVRNRRAAREAQENAYEETLRSDEKRLNAERLLSIVPERTIELLLKRVKRCYDRFNNMLENEKEYFEEDITAAAKNALPACVCRNLGMIVDIAGDLPDEELEEAWQEYRCKHLQRSSFRYM